MDPGKAWPRWLVAAILWTALAAQASDVRIQDEYSALIRRGTEISALGADLFGDTVNLYTGAVEFVQHDIELPGNFALPVGVGRRFTTGRGDAWGGGHFGDWDLEIPRIHGVFSLDGGWTVNGSPASARCSRFGEPPIVHGIGGPSGGAFSGIEYWQGTMLCLPGRGDEEILLRNPATPVPSDGRDYPLVTRGGAAISCLEITDGTAKGEGFEVVTQDGTHYRFDHMVTRFFPNLQKTSPIPDAGVQQQPAGPSVAEFYVLLRQDSGTGGRYNIAGLTGDDSPGHSHPGEIGELPGRGDAGLTTVTGQTNYVFSCAGVFAIERTDVGYRVRQIEGSRLRGSAYRDMIKQIDAWNQSDGASNSGGVSCSSRGC